MRTTLVTIAAAALAVGAVAGCSSTDSSSDTTTTAAGGSSTTKAPGTTTGTATPGTVTEGTAAGGALEIYAQGSPYGEMLVDGDGRTLYAFTKDVEGQPSACTGACVDAWPIAAATEVVSPADAGGGMVETSILGVTDDGQATAGGHRLYYFVGDTNPGDTNGNGTGDVWFVVAPTGEPITAKA